MSTDLFLGSTDLTSGATDLTWNTDLIPGGHMPDSTESIDLTLGEHQPDSWEALNAHNQCWKTCSAVPSSTALHRSRRLTRWPRRKSGPHLLRSVQAFALHFQAYVAPLKSDVFLGQKVPPGPDATREAQPEQDCDSAAPRALLILRQR